METNLKKVGSILGVLCFSVATVFAGSYDSDDQDNNQNVAVPPAQYGSGEDCPTVFVSASYTLWTARQNGLAVAADNYYPAGTTSPTQGSVYYPDWKLRSGFKVGLGANLHHDGWIAMAEYTWFYNKKNSLKNLVSGSDGNAVAVLKTDPLLQPLALASADGSFENWFNRIDAKLARSFYAGHYLTYMPWLGIVGAWDKQNFDANYTANNISNVYRTRYEQKWWGVGPYFGTDAGFYLSKDWVLFINGGFALPWSKYDADTMSQDCGTANTSCSTIASTKNVFWNVSPMVESTLGIRWETWWSDHTWSFMLQAGWELQVWFDHNHAYTMGTPDAQNGNYTMQGLTIKAQANF